MISLQRIQRLAEAQRHAALLDEVITNGRPLPLSARLILSRSAAEGISALALGLQRAVELSYLATPASFMLARRLCRVTLDALASTKVGPDLSPAALALALAAWADLREQADLAGQNLDTTLDREMAHAEQTAAYALFECQQRAIASQHGVIATPVESALIIWQVGERPDLRERIAPSLDLALLRRSLGRARREADVRAVLDLAGLSTETSSASSSRAA
jgi:hypothetical protein